MSYKISRPSKKKSIKMNHYQQRPIQQTQIQQTQIQQRPIQTTIQQTQIQQRPIEQRPIQTLIQQNSVHQTPIEQNSIQQFKSINQLNFIQRKFSINDLNDFKLNWSIKNEIIGVLNEMIIVLNDDSVDFYDNFLNCNLIFRKYMDLYQKIDDLIKNLANLPLKLDDFCINNDNHNFIINSELIKNLIEQLVMNKNVIKYKELINEECKLNTINRNKEMILDLSNLPLQNINNANSNNQNCNQPFYDEVSNEKFITNSEFDKQLNRFENEIRYIRSEIEKLTINKLSSCVAFIFKLRNIKKFMKKDALYRSKMFICQDNNWYIRCESLFINDQRYMGIYLCSINNLNNESKSKLKTNFEFRILNQKPKANNMGKRLDYEFTRTQSTGIKKFISFKEIFNKKNCFVKNDLILIQLCLSVQLVTEK